MKNRFNTNQEQYSDYVPKKESVEQIYNTATNITKAYMEIHKSVFSHPLSCDELSELLSLNNVVVQPNIRKFWTSQTIHFCKTNPCTREATIVFLCCDLVSSVSDCSELLFRSLYRIKRNGFYPKFLYNRDMKKIQAKFTQLKDEHLSVVIEYNRYIFGVPDVQPVSYSP